ncbi:MAG: hypothetical protein JWM10_4470 [Myxococcaceae bacterium]|nr:hypothetical protein [Myxococcaceae bacterium]
MSNRIALLLIVLCGCSSTQASQIEIPAAGRPMWEQCRSAMDAWCHAQSQGDLTLNRDCEMNTTREYSRLGDEAARRSYLTTHRCTL